MRHKRLKLCAVLLLVLGLTGLQAQTMYVKESSGTQTAYTLSNVRKITFSSENVTVQKTDNSTGVYALSDLRYLSFKDFTTGIVQPIQQSKANLITYPNPVINVLHIEFTGTNNAGSISILTLDGKVMQKQETKGSKLITLNVSQLPQGIYLCRFTNETESKIVKIIKQ